MTGLASRDDKKDVDTGTNLVCEDSRLNIRNGTPSQLIFHSHESDNREIETNRPVEKKKKNQIMMPVFSVFTAGLCGHTMILRCLCTFRCAQGSPRLNPNGLIQFSSSHWDNVFDLFILIKNLSNVLHLFISSFHPRLQKNANLALFQDI